MVNNYFIDLINALAKSESQISIASYKSESWYCLHMVITKSAQSPKVKYKTEAEQTWTSTKKEIGSGAMKEYEHPMLTGHPLRVVFVVIGETEKSVVNSVINKGLTISLKKISRDST